MSTAEMKLTSLLPWFGSKRTMAPEIAQQLGPHSYYFEGCAGSMAVLFAKEPSEHEIVCDLHGGMTNLAWCVQESHSAARLFDELQRVLYSDELYDLSRRWLNERDDEPGDGSDGKFRWAYHYFIASWMGRNGVAGTARVNYQIATRWTKGGGSGPLRFRNAADSIPAWCERLRNVHILRRDMFEVLTKIEDDDGVAIYCDPPYLPGTVAGNSKYVYNFADADHARLAKELSRFKRARVVVSYYAAPELEQLYPGWAVIDCSRHKHLHCQNKRGSKRTEAPEVLLLNGAPITNATLFGETDHA
jgi:DNA adenine methylase